MRYCWRTCKAPRKCCARTPPSWKARNRHCAAARAALGDYEHADMQIQRWYMDVMEDRHVR
jgi:hypothetical protein